MQNKSGYAVALGMFDGMHIGQKHPLLPGKTDVKAWYIRFPTIPYQCWGEIPGCL